MGAVIKYLLWGGGGGKNPQKVWHCPPLLSKNFLILPLRGDEKFCTPHLKKKYPYPCFNPDVRCGGKKESVFSGGKCFYHFLKYYF